MASIKLTGDTSGEITISAPAVAGTNTITLPASSGTMVTSANIGDYATGFSGTDLVTLNSGNTSETLTASSNQIQFISTDDKGYHIVLPDMTTLTKGEGTFVFINPSIHPVGLKDAGGTLREYIPANSKTTLSIKDNSTANGVWTLNTDYTAGKLSVRSSSAELDLPNNLSAFNMFNLIKVNDTEYILLYSNASVGSPVYYAKLFTINLSTKAVTWGNEVALMTGAATYGIGSDFYSSMTGDVNDSNSGVIVIGEGVNDASGQAETRVVGFTVVAGTLHCNAATSIYTLAGRNYNFAQCHWCQADNCFLVYGSSMRTYSQPYARGVKITVSGTSVTTTLSTGSYTGTATTILGTHMGPVNLTTLAIDNFDYNGSRTFTDYVSYNTSTNTLSSGARTTQTESILNGYDVSYTDESSIVYPTITTRQYQFTYSTNTQAINCGRRQIIPNSDGTKCIVYNRVLGLTNPGTASMVVTNATIDTKGFLESAYSTVATYHKAPTPIAVSDSVELSTGNVRVLNDTELTKGKHYFTDNINKDKVYIGQLDNTTTTFNFNYGHSMEIETSSKQPYYTFLLSDGKVINFDLAIAKTQYATLNSKGSFDIIDPITPFKE